MDYVALCTCTRLCNQEEELFIRTQPTQRSALCDDSCRCYFFFFAKTFTARVSPHLSTRARAWGRNSLVYTLDRDKVSNSINHTRKTFWEDTRKTSNLSRTSSTVGVIRGRPQKCVLPQKCIAWLRFHWNVFLPKFQVGVFQFLWKAVISNFWGNYYSYSYVKYVLITTQMWCCATMAMQRTIDSWQCCERGGDRCGPLCSKSQAKIFQRLKLPRFLPVCPSIWVQPADEPARFLLFVQSQGDGWKRSRLKKCDYDETVGWVTQNLTPAQCLIWLFFSPHSSSFLWKPAFSMCGPGGLQNIQSVWVQM